jgi:hypothetical protein
MKLEKQLIMTIGMTQNNWELTREMVENSLNSFPNEPIIWNKNQEFKDYTDMKNYNNNLLIGMICEDANIVIEENNVYADIFVYDKYLELWKGKFDNWCIQFNDGWKLFKLDSIEVF